MLSDPIQVDAFDHVMQCMEVWGGNKAAHSAVSTPGLDVWVYSRPLEGARSGGDIHYLSSCATGRVTRLLLADVSGHGETVSDIALQLRALARRYVNVVRHSSFVKRLNREFIKRSDVNVFATAIVATYWAPKREIVICNAGHPRALRLRAGGAGWEALSPATGSEGLVDLPLGVVGSVDYDSFRLSIEDDDFVLLHTDFLTEVMDHRGRRLGEAGLIEILDGVCPGSQRLEPSVLVERVLDEIRAFSGREEPDDDVTLLLLARNDAAPRPIGPHLIGEWAGHWKRLVNEGAREPRVSAL